MVLTGANAMMSGAGANLVAQGVGMNPVMEAPGMLPVGMSPMRMGMPGDMGVPVAPGGPMMHDPSMGSGPSSLTGHGPGGTPDQGVPGPVNASEGVGQVIPGPGMPNMHMAGDIALQVRNLSSCSSIGTDIK